MLTRELGLSEGCLESVLEQGRSGLRAVTHPELSETSLCDHQAMCKTIQALKALQVP